MVMGCSISERLFAISEYHSRELILINNLLTKPEHKTLLDEHGGAAKLIYQAIIDSIEQARQLVPFALTLTREPAKEFSYYVWGEIHQLKFQHAFGSKISSYNRGPIPYAGGPHTVNYQAHFPNAKQYNVKVYPSFRMLVPTGSVKDAWAIMAPGNSGHLASKHYDDWLETFNCGKYNPMLYTQEQIEKNIEAVLTLQK